VEGMNVVDAIGRIKTNAEDRPMSVVKIVTAKVVS